MPPIEINLFLQKSKKCFLPKSDFDKKSRQKKSNELPEMVPMVHRSILNSVDFKNCEENIVFEGKPKLTFSDTGLRNRKM